MTSFVSKRFAFLPVAVILILLISTSSTATYKQMYTKHTNTYHTLLPQVAFQNLSKFLKDNKMFGEQLYLNLNNYHNLKDG